MLDSSSTQVPVYRNMHVAASLGQDEPLITQATNRHADVAGRMLPAEPTATHILRPLRVGVYYAGNQYLACLRVCNNLSVACRYLFRTRDAVSCHVLLEYAYIESLLQDAHGIPQ